MNKSGPSGRIPDGADVIWPMWASAKHGSRFGQATQMRLEDLADVGIGQTKAEAGLGGLFDGFWPYGMENGNRIND